MFTMVRALQVNVGLALLLRGLIEPNWTVVNSIGKVVKSGLGSVS